MRYSDACFRLQFERAAAAACLGQDLIQVVQVIQVGRQVGQALRALAARHRERLPDLGVGEARMRMHHRRVELVSRDLPLGVDHHVGHHHQAVDVRVQRAQAVAELLRQHRDHAPREVHRGRAALRLSVDDAARLDVVADIGDGHQQAPLAPPRVHRLGVHSIVEVAGVLAIDGDQRHVAQVDPVGQIGIAHRLGQAARRLDGRLVELVRHGELAHRDLDLHAGVVDCAQHFGHAAHRLHVALRLLDDLHHDHLAMLGTGRRTGRHQDVVLNALVLGHHDYGAALVENSTSRARAA